MGALNDAIREHLELKRRLGATEDEVKRAEDEAFGRGAVGRRSELEPSVQAVDSGPELEQAERIPPEPAAAAPDGETRETREAVSHDPEPDPEPAVFDREPPPDPLADELEPDEVLPEETLEHEPRVPRPEPSSEAEANGTSEEDVLEETPEFLEQNPDQERLWFEQKPPKDFDFD